ncbi:lysophospholipid acyltransferase family protein [soil metagenome]
MLYALIRRVVAMLARLVFRPEIVGRQHVPTRGPVILASNHLSFVDSVVIPMVLPRRVAIFAKREYFEGPGLKGRLTRMWFEFLGHIPFDRCTHRPATAALDTALAVLAKGEAFAIYPEGTRSRDGRLYRGRTGVGWLALTSRAPVVPVALIGTERIQPVGSRRLRVHRITVRFGVPLDFSAYAEPHSARSRRVVTDEVMRAIGELSGQEQAGQYNRRSSG